MRTIAPGAGVGPLGLGLTRQQLWQLTESNVMAYLGSSSEPGERSDDFVALGIHAHYWDGVCQQLAVFARTRPHYKVRPIMLDGEDISAMSVKDVQAFAELRTWDVREEDDLVEVPSEGLTFWFREDDEGVPRLDFVLVERPVAH